MIERKGERYGKWIWEGDWRGKQEGGERGERGETGGGVKERKKREERIEGK